MRVNIARPAETASSTDVGVKVIGYPDGQRELRLSHAAVTGPEEGFNIVSRAQHFADLELVIMAKRSLDGDFPGVPVDLYIPYLPGARSDRKFTKGGVRYLSEVIAPIVNRLGFRSVAVVDPHSDVAENVIDGMAKIPFYEVFAEELLKLGEGVTLLSPDAGAVKKTYDTGRMLGIKKVVSASKNRDPLTGRIVSVTVPPTDAAEIVVCDDICDGGKTFVELANAVKESNPGARMHLFVTHGIFSNPERTQEIFELYDSVCTTNSFRDLTNEEHEWAKHRECRLTQLSLL